MPLFASAHRLRLRDILPSLYLSLPISCRLSMSSHGRQHSLILPYPPLRRQDPPYLPPSIAIAIDTNTMATPKVRASILHGARDLRVV